MRVGIIGLGLSGIVNVAVLASFGHKVVAFDDSNQKISFLSKGIVNIQEPDVNNLLTKYKENISYTNEISKLKNVDIVIITLDNEKDKLGKINLDNFYITIEKIKNEITGGKVILIKTPLPVGTSQAVSRYLESKKFYVAFQSEILFSKTAVNNFLNPSRIVVGTSSIEAHMVINVLYERFFERKIYIYFTTLQCAELVRASTINYLMIKDSYINEMNQICSFLNVDGQDFVNAISQNSQMDLDLMKPSLGVSGFNFPSNDQEPFFIPHLKSKMFSTAISINHSLPINLVKKIKKRFGDCLTNVVVGVIGLAVFGTDNDVINAQSIRLIDCLLEMGASVIAYDNNVEMSFREIMGQKRHLKYALDVKALLRKSDCVIIMNDCGFLQDLDENYFVKYMPNKPIIFDAYDILKLNKSQQIEYHPVSEHDKSPVYAQ